mgnify:CR=1 FL=1
MIKSQKLREVVGSLLRPVAPRAPLALHATWEEQIRDLRRTIRERRYEELEPKLQAMEKWLDSEGSAHPELIEKTNQLGDYFQELAGDNLAAERLYRKALELAEGAPATHPGGLALSLNNLGVFELHARRHREAEELFDRLLPLAEETFGEESLEVASCLENLAAVYRATNRQDAATEVRSRAVRIRRKHRSNPGSSPRGSR